MTICLVSQEFPEETNFGGIATYMYYLSKGLNSIGEKVFVVCRSFYKDQVYVSEGITIIRLFAKDELDYRKKVSKTILSIHSTTPIDIIEAPEWQADLNDYFNTYKNVLNIPVVIKLHTPYFVWKMYNKYTSAAIPNDIELWEKNVICNADGILSCSDSLRQIVASEYQIDLSSIYTLPNMINVEDISGINWNSRDKESIYYIGSLEERKGVLILASAFKEIKKTYPNASLHFVGRDTHRNNRNISTIEYIRQIALDTPDIHFVDHVSNKDVFKYMKLANVVVFPSLYENFPYVVLEAMKCGCAIIGSKNGGMPEMIQENVSGLLYSPPSPQSIIDNVTKIFSNQTFAQKLGEKAQKSVAQFSTDIIIKQQINYYKHIIRNQGTFI